VTTRNATAIVASTARPPLPYRTQLRPLIRGYGLTKITVGDTKVDYKASMRPHGVPIPTKWSTATYSGVILLRGAHRCLALCRVDARCGLTADRVHLKVTLGEWLALAEEVCGGGRGDLDRCRGLHRGPAGTLGHGSVRGDEDHQRGGPNARWHRVARRCVPAGQFGAGPGDLDAYAVRQGGRAGSALPLAASGLVRLALLSRGGPGHPGTVRLGRDVLRVRRRPQRWLRQRRMGRQAARIDRKGMYGSSHVGVT
jgi:hypothetical protein